MAYHGFPSIQSLPRRTSMTHAELLLQHQLHPDDDVGTIAARLAKQMHWSAEEQQRVAERLYDIRKTATAILRQEQMFFPLVRSANNMERYISELDGRLRVARRQEDDMDEH